MEKFSGFIDIFFLISKMFQITAVSIRFVGLSGNGPEIKTRYMKDLYRCE